MRVFRGLLSALSVAAVGVVVTAIIVPGAASGSQQGVSGPPNYVALGDSYTAGPFIRPIRPGGMMCGRSAVNYPSQVAAALGARLTDMSCGGAVTANIDQRAQGANPVQTSGITPATTLVSLSIGGNDEGLYASLMTTCRTVAAMPHVVPNPCQVRLGAATPGILARTQASIERVLRAVHAKAPSATVLVVGYPHILPPSGTCAALPFAAGDYPWMASTAAGLSDALQKAVANDNNRSIFVDTAGPSSQHSVCSASPWVNGFSIGADGSIQGHPNKQGMTGIAQAVLSTYRQHQ